MSMPKVPAVRAEIARRDVIARAAMLELLELRAGEFSVSLYVKHHLSQLGASYWQERFGVANPDPARVLDSLVLRSHWGGEDGIDSFDYSLPGDVTQYVISVQFDRAGRISSVSMES